MSVNPNRRFDEEGYERRTEVMGEVDCPTCGEPVGLVSETDEWVEGTDGRWLHSGWGPASGVCCGNLIVDSWGECEVYELGGEA